MTCMRRAALLLGSILCLATLVTAVARADGGAPVRIRDLRVGDHSGFERLVIELDADTDVVWENGPEPGEESFYIAAAPQQRSRVIVTQLPHIGTISVTQMKGGTHVAIEPRERRVRAYVLLGPPRLVVDFAAPAMGAFAAPAGTRALEPATTIGPLVLDEPAPSAEPEPKPAPAPKPAPVKAAEPAPTTEPEPVEIVEPEPVVEPAPTPEPPLKAAEPAPTPEPAATPEPTPAPEPAPTPESASTPEPAAAAEPAPAAKSQPEPSPAAKPAPPAPTAPPAATAESEGGGFPYGLALAALLGLALAIAAGVLLARRRAERDEPVGAWVPPDEDDDDLPATRVDEISPAEILAAGDPEAMLEKRLDEEVRARLELEQRFAGANEELKVLRDRLHRLERRREGGAS
jgi:hypothetical protein